MRCVPRFSFLVHSNRFRRLCWVLNEETCVSFLIISVWTLLWTITEWVDGWWLMYPFVQNLRFNALTLLHYIIFKYFIHNSHGKWKVHRLGCVGIVFTQINTWRNLFPLWVNRLTLIIKANFEKIIVNSEYGIGKWFKYT